MREGIGTAGALGDPAVLVERRSRIFDAHVEPLNRWVERLRIRLPEGAEVPWFDPADGGVHARLLWLGDEPAPTDLYSGGGAGFVSLDATDARSRNLHAAADAAGVDRGAFVMWNATPCNLGQLRKATKDAPAAVPSPALLRELIDLLPGLEVVVLAGRNAWQVFQHLDDTAELFVLSTPEVRDDPLDARPRERSVLHEAWREAVAAAAPPAVGTALVPLADDLLGEGMDLAELEGDGGPDLLIQPISDTEAMVFGADVDLAPLGLMPSHQLPSPQVELVRAAIAGAPGFKDMAMGSGRLVLMSKESAKLLRKNRPVSAGGKWIYGVVRSKKSSQWAGNLKFAPLGPAAILAAPAVLSSLAEQQQMAAIERRLAAVQERLDELVLEREQRFDTELVTNLEILAGVADRVRRRGVIEPAQWQQLAVIQPRVVDFQKRTRLGVAALNEALDPGRPTAMRVKALTGLARDEGLAHRLVRLVKAEVALTQWRFLQLQHDIQEHPEELEFRTDEFLTDTRDRHQQMVTLARRLDAYLGAGVGAGLLDRARAALQRDAVAMREGLADVLDAYRNQMTAMGLETPPPVPALAELTVGDQLSDSFSAVRHRLGRRKAGG